MTVDATEPETPPVSSTPGPPVVPHYLFLDGMRGLAALWVVLFHMQGVVQTSLASGRLQGAPLPHFVTALLAYGHDAVAVFIVLSGFCISLPVFRASNGELRGGLQEFFRRRARRLLPAYYAAVVLGLLNAFVWYQFQSRQVQQAGTDTNPTVWLEMFKPGMIISHFLLVQNWSPAWNTGITPALWSLAVEWQIYFVFALILLPVWRAAAARWGGASATLAAVAAGFVLGYAPQLLLPAPHNGDWGCPWLLALFGLGMAAAVITTQDAKSHAGKSRALLYFSCLVLLAAALLVVRSLTGIAVKCSDPVVGMATISLILLCTSRPSKSPSIVLHGRNVIRAALESRPLLMLGTISYSLYLTHGYVLVPVRWILMRVQLGAAAFELTAYAFAVGLAVLLASPFYRVFEKPFMASARTSGRSALPVLTTQAATT